MEVNQNKWVVFGAGKAGKAAYSVLDGNVSFFIDSNRELTGTYIGEGVPIISLNEAKPHLHGKSVVMAVADSLQEREMRNSLSDCDAGQILSMSELSHINPCRGYDYSEILDAIWQQNLRHEYVFHLKEWKDYTSRVLLDPMNMICEKYGMRGRKLADVACGYGFWSLFFALRQIEVSGIDNDADRLKIFGQLAEKHRGLTSLLSDIRDMADIDTSVYDITFCANTVHVVPDWRRVIGEMIRITKSNGHIVLVVTRVNSAYIKNLYKDFQGIQWDATPENIIEAAAQGADLSEKIDIYGNEREIRTSNEPTHSLLVFTRQAG